MFVRGMVATDHLASDGSMLRHLDSVGGSELLLNLAGRSFGCICGLDEFVNPNLIQRIINYSFRPLQIFTKDFFRVSKELAYNIFFLILAESGHQDIRNSFCFLDTSVVPCNVHIRISRL